MYFFMIKINSVFCKGRTCGKQRWDAFQSARLTGVRLWAVSYNTPDTVADHEINAQISQTHKHEQ